MPPECFARTPQHRKNAEILAKWLQVVWDRSGAKSEIEHNVQCPKCDKFFEARPIEDDAPKVQRPPPREYPDGESDLESTNDFMLNPDWSKVDKFKVFFFGAAMLGLFLSGLCGFYGMANPMDWPNPSPWTVAWLFFSVLAVIGASTRYR